MSLYSEVTNRFRDTLKIIDNAQKYTSGAYSVSNADISLEMMSFCYVIVYGSIEFMIESILREWVKRNILYHENSSKYLGRKRISSFLKSINHNIDKNIANFNSSKIDNFRTLIHVCVGDEYKNKFNLNLRRLPTLEQEVNSRLDRIGTIRHLLAHGQKLPTEIQPNLDELKDDFKYIYKNIVRNLISTLPRV